MDKQEQLMREKLDEYGIPEYMHAGVMLYVMEHIAPGDFLMALMSNNLKDAFARADENNVASMNMWLTWFYNWAPSPCWASAERVNKWLAMREAKELEQQQ